MNLADLTISAATPDDLPALVDLACAAFGDDSRELAEEEFPTGFAAGVRCPVYLLVARDGDTPIGLVGVMEDYIYIDTFCLCWVAVAPEYRHRGIGSTLVEAGIAYAAALMKRPQGSVVLVAAEDKRGYYARFGFEGTTPIHPYLTSTQPHHLLTRRITKTL